MRAAPRRSHTRRMSEIRVNGVSLYYEEHGAGEPILCIHGTGSSAALWVDAAAELATHGRAIVYDRRGFSRSERPEPYVTDVHQHADDAAALDRRSRGGAGDRDRAQPRRRDRGRPRAALPGPCPRAGAAGGRGAVAERGVDAVAGRARRAGLRRGRGRHEHRRRDDAARRPGRCRLGGIARAGEADVHRQRPGDRRRAPRRPPRRQRGAARHRSSSRRCSSPARTPRRRSRR